MQLPLFLVLSAGEYVVEHLIGGRGGIERVIHMDTSPGMLELAKVCLCHWTLHGQQAVTLSFGCCVTMSCCCLVLVHERFTHVIYLMHFCSNL